MSALTGTKVFDMQYSSMVKRQTKISDALISNHHRYSVANIRIAKISVTESNFTLLLFVTIIFILLSLLCISSGFVLIT